MKQQLDQLGNGAHVLAMQMLGNPDDATDIAQGTVMSRLHRARMDLKQELSRYDH